MKACLFLFLAVFIVSCGNLSLETDPIVVSGIDDGRVLSAGDFFNISFNKSSKSVIVNPTSADVEIIYQGDSRGDILVEPILFSIDILDTPNPRFQITPDFKDGLYTINVVVYEHDSILSEYKSEFIVYSGLLSGDVSTLYPLENIYPDSKIILESNVHYDDNIDPYLVWSFDGEVFEEGYLSEGINFIIWDTAGRYGFMDINLDLYPYKLGNVRVGSDRTVDFSFVVNPLDSELYDPILMEHYYKSLFFNGNYIDEVDKYRDIISSQEMNPKVVNNFFGMESGGNLGFITYDSAIPVDPATGYVESFSLILDFQLLRLDNGSLLKNNHGDLSFSLYLEDGVLKHSFVVGDELPVIVDIMEGVTDDSIGIVITFVRVADGYNIFYYVNGNLETRSQWVFFEDELELELNYSFEVGGSENTVGFSGIIDKIQVYYRDNYCLNNIYPDNLVDSFDGYRVFDLIDGFNSIHNPQNLFGDGVSNGEILEMGSGSYLTYQNILPLDKDYMLNISGGYSDNYILRIYDDSLEPFEWDLSGYSVIKRKGDLLFINNEMIEGWSGDRNSFSIISPNTVSLDYVTLETMDRVVE